MWLNIIKREAGNFSLTGTITLYEGQEENQIKS